jgi:hypothetical protein
VSGDAGPFPLQPMVHSAAAFRVRVDVSVEQIENGGALSGRGLRVCEELALPQMSFLELAGVLGQFHALAETIAGAQQDTGWKVAR